MEVQGHCQRREEDQKGKEQWVLTVPEGLSFEDISFQRVIPRDFIVTYETIIDPSVRGFATNMMVARQLAMIGRLFAACLASNPCDQSLSTHDQLNPPHVQSRIQPFSTPPSHYLNSSSRQFHLQSRCDERFLCGSGWSGRRRRS